MRRSNGSPRPLRFALVMVLATVMLGGRADATEPAPTPKAVCGPGSNPESGLQGRRQAGEVDAITCNTQVLSRFGNTGIPGGSGGYKVFRYRDVGGHTCAYYDSTLLLPLNVPTQRENLPGVVVLDMSDPSRPVKTANLLTPAMQSPHESLSFNQKRGLLAAGMGNPLTGPGFVDIFDLSKDCRHPVLLSSTPFGIVGHEGNFSPDGNTLWITSTAGSLITALDVSDPILPKILFTDRRYRPHGLNISNDGNRLYLADTTAGAPGLTILDVSQIQKRRPNPTAPVVSHLTWDTVSIPQNAIPVTISGRRYIIEIDEFSRGLGSGTVSPPIGAARIIDVADEKNPFVLSDIRLEVNQAEHAEELKNDPGARFFLQGYTGHYCSVPQRKDPGILACSFILSGLRVFDIRNPSAPKEIAYFNGPLSPTHAPLGAFPNQGGGSYAMSAPAFAPSRGEIWYSDGNSGFYAVRLTNGVWPFA